MQPGIHCSKVENRLVQNLEIKVKTDGDSITFPDNMMVNNHDTMSLSHMSCEDQ